MRTSNRTSAACLHIVCGCIKRPDGTSDFRLYLALHNFDPKPFVWVKTADDILANIAAIACKHWKPDN